MQIMVTLYHSGPTNQQELNSVHPPVYLLMHYFVPILTCLLLLLLANGGQQPGYTQGVEQMMLPIQACDVLTAHTRTTGPGKAK